MVFTQNGIHVNLWDAKCFVSVTRQFVFDSAPVALWITDMHVKIKKAPGKKVAPWRLLRRLYTVNAALEASGGQALLLWSFWDATDLCATFGSKVMSILK